MVASRGVAQSLIIAGATGYGVWPANSLEGARGCLAAPIDGLEIDVQMTADGRVVAHHDYRLNPDATRRDGRWLAGPGRPLKTLTFAELAAYDVGAARPGSEQARRHGGQTSLDGVAIPPLEAILEILRSAPGPRRRLYVEVKTDPTNPDVSPEAEAVSRAVLDAVDAADWAAEVKIIAFDWRVLRLTKALRPDMATAHLTIPPGLAGPRAWEGDSPWRDGCDTRHHGGSDLAAIKAHGGMEWSPYFTDITRESLEEAAGLGLRVGPWGLSKPADVDRMLALGVFSITVAGPYWGR